MLPSPRTRALLALTLTLAGAVRCRPASDAFPCASDGSCPSGYACARDRLCHAGGVPLRLLAPISTSFATSTQPLFRWEPSGSDVTIDVCRDPACAPPIASFAASGGSARPPAPLPPDVLFWRVRSAHSATMMTATWQLTVPARDSGRVTSWGAAPDFDGDGFADLAVGVRAPGQPGAVQIFRGGPHGPAATPDWTLTGDAELGATVAAVGDLDGDGRGDLAVASSRGAGAVWIYFGGGDGFSAPVALDAGPVTRGFGASITAAGDVDGDGYGDLLVGGQEAAQLFSGGSLRAAGARMPRQAALMLAGGQLVCGGADFDGDGWPDAVVAQSSGLLYLGTGATLVLRTTPKPLFAGRLGGDVDGDGRSDFASYAIYPGGDLGPDIDHPLLVFPGMSFVTGVGDVNGDGYGDALADLSSLVGARESKRVYFGSAAACETDDCARFAPLLYPGGNDVSPIEPAVIAGAGDVNGDGFADVVIATPISGNVYLFMGGASGPATAPSVTLTGGPGFGAAVAGL
jgi:hypothetical protein